MKSVEMYLKHSRGCWLQTTTETTTTTILWIWPLLKSSLSSLLGSGNHLVQGWLSWTSKLKSLSLIQKKCLKTHLRLKENIIARRRLWLSTKATKRMSTLRTWPKCKLSSNKTASAKTSNSISKLPETNSKNWKNSWTKSSLETFSKTSILYSRKLRSLTALSTTAPARMMYSTLGKWLRRRCRWLMRISICSSKRKGTRRQRWIYNQKLTSERYTNHIRSRISTKSKKTQAICSQNHLRTKTTLRPKSSHTWPHAGSATSTKPNSFTLKRCARGQTSWSPQQFQWACSRRTRGW